MLELLSWFLLRAVKNDILILLKLSFILIKNGLIGLLYALKHMNSLMSILIKLYFAGRQ